MEKMTAGKLSGEARRISAGLGIKDRLLMTYRPMICPFDVLAEYVPAESRVLDVGCGSGLWLYLLSRCNRIVSGVGVDVDVSRIETAESLKSEEDNLEFSVIGPEGELPVGEFDCLTMIDVLHHVKLEGQKEFLAKINSVGAGRVIFKDIDPAARVKSIFNTVHDILLSHQRPNYCSKEEVAGWLEEFGFKVSCVKRCDMLWYSHYLIVADKV